MYKREDISKATPRLEQIQNFLDCFYFYLFIYSNNSYL